MTLPVARMLTSEFLKTSFTTIAIATLLCSTRVVALGEGLAAAQSASDADKMSIVVADRDLTDPSAAGQLSFELRVAGGRATESKAGAAALTAAVVAAAGTKEHARGAFKGLDFSIEPTATWFRGTIPAGEFDARLRHLGMLLAAPDVDPELTERVLRGLRDKSPYSKLDVAASRAHYGEVIALDGGLNIAAAIEYYLGNYRPERMRLIIYGGSDVDRAHVESVMAGVEWRPSRGSAAPARELSALAGPSIVLNPRGGGVHRETSAGTRCRVSLGRAVAATDRAALLVAAQWLEQRAAKRAGSRRIVVDLDAPRIELRDQCDETSAIACVEALIADFGALSAATEFDSAQRRAERVAAAKLGAPAAQEITALSAKDVQAFCSRALVPARMHLAATGPATLADVFRTHFGLSVIVIGAGAPSPDGIAIGDGKQLFAEVLEAMGGAERLASVRNIAWQSNEMVNDQGQSTRRETISLVRFPYQFRVEANINDQQSVFCLNDTSGWSLSPRGVTDLNVAQVASFRQSLALSTTPLLRAHAEVATRELPPVMHAGVPHRVLEVTRPGEVAVRFHVDPESHRIAFRSMKQPATGGASSLREESLQDYREVGGLWLPHLRRLSTDGQFVRQINVRQYQLDVDLPQGAFSKPKVK